MLTMAILNRPSSIVDLLLPRGSDGSEQSLLYEQEVSPPAPSRSSACSQIGKGGNHHIVRLYCPNALILHTILAPFSYIYLVPVGVRT
jgi:hypothetical protein